MNKPLPQSTTGMTVIRPSSLTSWGDCPRRAAAGLFRREITEAGYELHRSMSNIGATVGTAVHAAAAEILTDKMNRGELTQGSRTAGEQAALESLGDQVEQGVAWDQTSPTLSVAERQVIRMTRVYHEVLAPTIQPIAVEERLMVDVGGGFILSGQKDTMARRGGGALALEPARVRDLKTGAVSRTHAPQLGAYTLIERSQNPPRHVEGAAVDFIQRVSPNKDQPPPVSTNYPLEDIEFVARHRINRVKSEMTEFRRRLVMGDEPPEWAFDNNGSSMLCSEKFCPAFGTEFCGESKYKESK